MLDADTKRRIDTARDILVGKIPDPKSQVEQITVALIYKFMDDMDAQSEEKWKGKRSFFAGDFARYGWAKLMAPGLGGYEMLNLYTEAIIRMRENPGLPPLFRDIFNNAYLPYRDAETLRAFLKVIDEFDYDHSERLGDAFEYLLSILGAQGDAGQFRTPRHIIDFIVEIIDPQKGETVLDPACGTAGFLISAYKRILEANSDADGQSTLTPDEMRRLADDFSGYDISPDMVRLSLVNMYLHGFREPHVHEYDTLTSEDRWNEYADVILANPPFMSPRGGIRPHNRFSVQSRRSEVLFVDYIAEHLTANGRAGVIVPEGIIFQSQNAYKQLRKMLVEEYLVAVVSLPSGVFRPYSGVKTSVLIMDKSLARKTDSIAFFKVENDGFDLGDRRGAIAANDLPHIQLEIGRYLQLLRIGDVELATSSHIAEPRSEYATETMLGVTVNKEKIAEDGEYNLSVERYQEEIIVKTEFPFVELESIADIAAGNPAPQDDEYFKAGEFSFIRTSDVGAVHRSDNFIGAADKVNQGAVEQLRLRKFPKGTILFPKSGASTFLNHRVRIGEAAYVSSHLACIIPDEKKALSEYVYHLLCQIDARRIVPNQSYPSLRLKTIGSIRIPLPPLGVQREIVAEIEGYQKVMDGARTVVDNWRPHIAVDPEWPVAKVSNIFCQANDTILPSLLATPTTYIGLENISQHTGQLVGDITIDLPSEVQSVKKMFDHGDILYGRLRPNLNKVWSADRQGICSTDIFVIRSRDDNVLPILYATLFRSEVFNTSVLRRVSGAQLPRIAWSQFQNLEIPLIPMEAQRKIVAQMEAERAIVVANHELIQHMDKRIESTVARTWRRQTSV